MFFTLYHYAVFFFFEIKIFYKSRLILGYPDFKFICSIWING